MRKIHAYEIVEIHDDGDLTIEDSEGKLYVVTTAGQVFEQKPLIEQNPSTVESNRRVKYRYEFLLDESPYDIGEEVGMGIDTIPEALENLKVSYAGHKVLVTPSLITPQAYDLYWTDLEGKFIADFSSEDLRQFEEGIRDWLRKWREAMVLGSLGFQLWPQNKYVRVLSPGQTVFSFDDLVLEESFNKENERVRNRGDNPATGELWEGGKPRRLAQTNYEGKEKPQKLLPALKPFEPHKFAEYVLRSNVFDEYEIPIYSGITGTNPHKVPDLIWAETLAGIEGEFVKMGDLYVVKTPGVERPPDMRAAPTWREITPLMSTKDKSPAVIPTEPSPSPKRQDALEYLADSPEFLTQTIDESGWRETLDKTFLEAIQRVRGE